MEAPKASQAQPSPNSCICTQLVCAAFLFLWGTPNGARHLDLENRDKGPH